MSIGRLPIIFRVSLSFQDHTYINRSLSYQSEFGVAPILVMLVQSLGLHLYRSVIFRVSLSQGRTYIDRACSYHILCLV